MPNSHADVLLDSTSAISQTTSSPTAISGTHITSCTHIGVLDVLHYMKKAFDDETVLDMLPLEAAGNPGAWNSWRAHRKLNFQHTCPRDDMAPESSHNKVLIDYPKQQDDWNWEGVWEERVQKGVDASISDAALYGNAGGGDDLV